VYQNTSPTKFYKTRLKTAYEPYAVFSAIVKIACRLFAFDFIFARDSFAGLIAYRAAGFASRLTGASAFAASRYFLFGGFCNGLNHDFLFSYEWICWYYYNILLKKLQAV
jgi:hypothetical protein